MPFKPKKPCAFPLCAELTHDRYCERHKRVVDKQYNSHERDKAAASFYSKDARWLAIRKKKLQATPTCEECKFEKATTVDHIKPISQGGDKYDWNNLQSMCRRCHSSKSAREGSRWGGRGRSNP